MNSATNETPAEEVGHRILLQHPVHGSEGLAITLASDPNQPGAETWLALHDRGNDIILYVGIDWNQASAVLSRRSGGEWADQMTVPIPKADPLAITLALKPGAINVALGGGAPLEWPIRDFRDEVFSLHVLGQWSLESCGPVVRDDAATGAVLAGLPVDKNLAGTLDRRLIFDIGMHNGDDSAYYLRKGFRVVAIEANPNLCAAAAARFASEIAAGHLVVCNIGVAPARGELVFYINQAISEWSSFNRDIASRGHPVSEVKVPTARPEDFFSAFGVPYYCKIDIEGFDRLLVDAVAGLPLHPCYLSFENGVLRDFETLAAAGYEAFQLVEQSAIPNVRLPESSAEGQTITHDFPYGSSGPFGKDLAGPWLDVAETRAMLEQHHRELAERAERGYDWWDLHARHRDA